MYDHNITRLEVPEWQSAVYVRGLTVGEVKRVRKETDNIEQTALMVQAACLDEGGQPLFKSVADVHKLQWAPVERIAVEILSQSSMGKEKSEDNSKSVA